MTGKIKCEFLKAMRREIAEKNGIELALVPECTYDGPCSGHCPVCDKEARALSDAIAELEKDGKAVKLDGEFADTIRDEGDSKKFESLVQKIEREIELLGYFDKTFRDSDRGKTLDESRDFLIKIAEKLEKLRKKKEFGSDAQAFVEWELDYEYRVLRDLYGDLAYAVSRDVTTTGITALSEVEIQGVPMKEPEINSHDVMLARLQASGGTFDGKDLEEKKDEM